MNFHKMTSSVQHSNESTTSNFVSPWIRQMTHLDNEELFDEYVKISDQIKALEKYKALLADAINDRRENNLLEDFRDGTNWKHQRLTMKMATRRTWAYSEAVASLKALEEREGVATRRTTTYPVFTVKDA